MTWFKKLSGIFFESTTVPPPGAHDQAADLQPDQLPRKARSEALLRKQRVPINPWLPVIESEAEVEIRTPQEIANRLLALTVVAAKGTDPQATFIDRVMEEFGVAEHLTPAERAFMMVAEPQMEDRIKFSWQCEAAIPLFWALRLIDRPLGRPTAPCEPTVLQDIIIQTPDLTHRGLRPASEILDEADLIYRYHWAVRQAGLDGMRSPAGLDDGVTLERHRGLNWLIGYADRADWDDVSMDT